MKLVIDLDENVYTRLFDNGLEDYAIVTDDLFAIAKSIRNATPLTDCTDAISREEVMKLKTRIDKYGDMIYAFDVNRLPSVNPMPDLSKIRTEIENEMVHDDWDIGNESIYNNAIRDVLAIIDKYKVGDSDE